jgi:hypothetical protein
MFINQAKTGREARVRDEMDRIAMIFSVGGGALAIAFSGVSLAGAPPRANAAAVEDSSPGQ